MQSRLHLNDSTGGCNYLRKVTCAPACTAPKAMARPAPPTPSTSTFFPASGELPPLPPLLLLLSAHHTAACCLHCQLAFPAAVLPNSFAPPSVETLSSSQPGSHTCCAAHAALDGGDSRRPVGVVSCQGAVRLLHQRVGCANLLRHQVLLCCRCQSCCLQNIEQRAHCCNFLQSDQN
jgi:hypothetical protein